MKRLTHLLCLAFLLLFGANVSAAPITVPSDLNPGDHYRLAFLTPTSRDATSADIADYNAFVTTAANSIPELLALGTTWTAIASTDSVDARDNTATNPIAAVGVPLYSLYDMRIADSNADLWDGSIGAPIEPSLYFPYPEYDTWTGTSMDGTRNPRGAMGSLRVTFGLGSEAGEYWIAYGPWDSVVEFQIYGISGDLTVVPDPGAMIQLCIGAAAVVGSQLRRRRQRTPH